MGAGCFAKNSRESSGKARDDLKHFAKAEHKSISWVIRESIPDKTRS